MSTIGLTEALTRLLSDADLRDVYRRDGLEAASELSLSADDLSAFLSLDPSEVDRQAQGLISKRFYEVSRLIPQTLHSVGDASRRHFHEYATQFWPMGHQRHLIDAVEYCGYLKDNNLSLVICRSELNWLRFSVSRTTCSIHFVADLVVHGKRRRAIQLFFRWRGVARGFAWHIGSFRSPQPKQLSPKPAIRPVDAECDSQRT